MGKDIDQLTLRDITSCMGELVEHIQCMYERYHLPGEPPFLQETTFKLLRDAAFKRGNVVLVWSVTQSVADAVLINIVRKLTVGDQLATLMIEPASEDRLKRPAEIISSLMRCQTEMLLSGSLADTDWDALSNALAEVHDAPLHLASGSIRSLARNIAEWRGEIRGGSTQLVILNDPAVFERDGTAPTIPTIPTYGRVSDLAAALSEVAHQTGICIFVAIAGPFNGTLSPQALMKKTASIPTLRIESTAIDLIAPDRLRLSHACARGQSMSDYRYTREWCRIDWAQDEIGSAPESNDHPLSAV